MRASALNDFITITIKVNVCKPERIDSMAWAAQEWHEFCHLRVELLLLTKNSCSVKLLLHVNKSIEMHPGINCYSWFNFLPTAILLLLEPWLKCNFLPIIGEFAKVRDVGHIFNCWHLKIVSKESACCSLFFWLRVGELFDYFFF
jgi:hypothetical protein